MSQMLLRAATREVEKPAQNVHGIVPERRVPPAYPGFRVKRGVCHLYRV